MDRRHRRGNRPFTDFVSADRVVAAYQVFGSLRHTARVLDTTKDTIKKILEKQGVTIYDAKHARHNAPTHVRKSAFAKWLDDWLTRHADGKLPRSLSELSKISGVSYNAVKSYMYRRRKERKDLLSRLGDLRKLDLILEDNGGRKWSSSMILAYDYFVDKYTLRVTLKGYMKNGETAIFPIVDVERFALFTLKLKSSPGSQSSIKMPSKSHLGPGTELPSQDSRAASSPEQSSDS